jgi:hypothetical protein
VVAGEQLMGKSNAALLRNCLTFLFSAIFTFASVWPPASASNDYEHRPNVQSNLAFSDLSACLSRDIGQGKKPGLDVVFLVDESWSIWLSDPLNDRKDILANTAQQIVDLKLPNTGFNVITFSGRDPNIPDVKDTKIRIPWTDVNNSHPDVVPKRIRSTASTWVTGKKEVPDSGGNTDWEAALRSAQDSFQLRENTHSENCKALIWFTDGGVNVQGNVQETRNSLKRICGRDPGTNSPGSGSSALINFLRSNQVSIFGVLYTRTAKHNSSEASRQSFMRSVVEGQGVANTEFLGGENSRKLNYTCGETLPDQPRGVLMVAGDVFRLASEFSSIGPMLTPETPLNLSGDKNQFRIGSGIESIDVQIPLCGSSAEAGANCQNSNKTWSLTAPDGTLLADQSGAQEQDVNLAAKSSYFASVHLKMKTEWAAKSLKDPKTFKVVRRATEPLKVWLNTGLFIELEHSKFIAGKSTKLVGKVVRPSAENEGEKVQLSHEYDDAPSPTLKIDALTGNSSVHHVELASDGSFTAEYKVPNDISLAKLHLSFLAHSLGSAVMAHPLEVVADIQNPAAYPYVTPNRIKFSTPLIGNGGRGEAILYLHSGAKGSRGKICFGDPEVTQDSGDKDRLSKFEFSGLEGADSSNCFELLGGLKEPLKLTLLVENRIPAKATVLGTLAVNSTSSSERAELSRNISWTLETDYSTNKKKEAILILLFLLLGLAIPYALLLGINYFLNRLVIPPSIRVAFMQIQVKGNAEVSKSLLSGEDFKLIATPKTPKVRDFSFKVEGSPTFFIKAKFSLNPFRNPQAVIEAKGHVVITDLSTLKSTSAGAEISPMLTNLWLAGFKEADLSTTSASEPLSAFFIYFANLSPRTMAQDLAIINSEISKASKALPEHIEIARKKAEQSKPSGKVTVQGPGIPGKTFQRLQNLEKNEQEALIPPMSTSLPSHIRPAPRPIPVTKETKSLWKSLFPFFKKVMRRK